MEFTGERLVPGKVDLELETEHMNRYIFAKSLVNDKNVLDAACGTGYGSAILAERAQKVFGIDISKEAILYAKSNYQMKNLKFKSRFNFQKDDWAKLPIDVVSAVDYIKKNYPDCKVLTIEIEKNRTEVKLSNRVEVTFNKNNEVIDIDMD